MHDNIVRRNSVPDVWRMTVRGTLLLSTKFSVFLPRFRRASHLFLRRRPRKKKHSPDMPKSPLRARAYRPGAQSREAASAGLFCRAPRHPRTQISRRGQQPRVSGAHQGARHFTRPAGAAGERAVSDIGIEDQVI